MADGRTGGEWWRLDGPRRVLRRAAEQPAAEPASAGPDSVYGAEAPEDRVPVQVRRPAPGTAHGQVHSVGGEFAGWDSVQLDFSVADPLSVPVAAPPEAQTGEPQAEPWPVPAQGAPAAPAATPGRGLLTGRRPSPLLLLAGLLLVAGAATGLVLVMLVGWAAAYLSRKLGDLTKKFAVFGIPLVTMSASAVWFWGRTKGRWGDPLPSGAPMTHAAWDAAPDVLRIAAVLSAVFLLAVALRRKAASSS